MTCKCLKRHRKINLFNYIYLLFLPFLSYKIKKFVLLKCIISAQTEKNANGYIIHNGTFLVIN